MFTRVKTMMPEVKYKFFFLNTKIYTLSAKTQVLTAVLEDIPLINSSTSLV